MLLKGIIASGGKSRDRFFKNVALLLPMNTNFLDFSSYSNSTAIFGSAAISTSVKRFEEGSGAFSTSGDYLSINETSNLGLGTQNFTIEMWVFKTTSIINWNGIFELGTGANPYQNGLLFRLQTVTDSFYIANTAYNWNPSTNFTLNQWNHLAIVRNDNNFKIYVNGNNVLSVTNSANLGPTSRIIIGASAHNTNQVLGGYIDEFRITKGVARYTDTFTPPELPFPKK